MSVFAKPTQSKYTEKMQRRAHAPMAVAQQCAVIGESGIGLGGLRAAPGVQDVIITGIEQVSKGAKNIGWAILLTDAVNSAPDVLYPESPLFDTGLCDLLGDILTRFEGVTRSTMTQSMAMCAAVALANSNEGNGGGEPRPKIWAKSQANGLLSALKDYRFRPSLGGIRL